MSGKEIKLNVILISPLSITNSYFLALLNSI
jgi:hypothetical protein